MHQYGKTCKNVHLYLNATERRHFAEHFDQTVGEPHSIGRSRKEKKPGRGGL
jgi:hypothetical protein